MSRSTSNPSIQYAAELDNVREVNLRGTADLPFWNAILQQEELAPYNSKGKAELLISATDAKWKGFKFRELSIAVAVSDDADGASHDGYFLAHAFNSSRLLAFAERAFFQTPYYQGDIQIETKLPAFIKLSDKQETRLHYAMSAERTPVNVGYEEWRGPIYLPGKMTKGNTPGGKFFAVLSGEITTYPFSPTTDRAELHPSAQHPILRWLVESGFAGEAWSIRNSAFHAKSKTYKRDFKPQ